MTRRIATMKKRLSAFAKRAPRYALAAAVVPLLVAAAPARTVIGEELGGAVDPFELKADHRTVLGLYLTSREAYRYLKADPTILFIDARSRAEVNFLGMPDPADANIPYGFVHPGYRLGQDGRFYNRLKNEYFVEAVRELIARQGLTDNPLIFVICRAGYGAARVVDELAGAGFTRVYSIVDGFEGDLDEAGKRTINGWKSSGLPWSYGIGEERAYRPPMEAIGTHASN